MKKPCLFLIWLGLVSGSVRVLISEAVAVVSHSTSFTLLIKPYIFKQRYYLLLYTVIFMVNSHTILHGPMHVQLKTIFSSFLHISNIKQELPINTRKTLPHCLYVCYYCLLLLFYTAKDL